MNIFGSKWLRAALVGGLALLLIGGAAGKAAAFDFRRGDTITILSGEIIDDDLFISASRVVVDGTVNGDLFVIGAEVEINGAVNGSLFAVGQSVTLNGSVSGSAYTCGMSVTYGPQAAVSRNAAFGGFGFEMQPGSAIERDLIAGGYQAVLAGAIGRHVQFSGSALELNGSVGGDVTAEVDPQGNAADVAPLRFFSGMPDPVAPGLRISDQATLGGKLTYTSLEAQAGAIRSEPEGGIVYQTPQPDDTAAPRPQPGVAINVFNWILDRLRDFVTLMLLGALIVWQLPSLLNSVAEQAGARPLPSAGWGLVVVIVGYAGAVIAGILIFIVGILLGVVTLGGLSQTVFGVGFSGLGLVFTMFTLLVSYGSKLVVAYLVGKLIWHALSPQTSGNKWMPLVIGVSLYVVLSAIPIIGWLIAAAVTLVGLGAMWLLFRDWRRPIPAPSAATS